MATLTSTGITFSDGSTTASNSTFGAIGSVALLYHAGTALVLPGGTIAGSSLVYPSTVIGFDANYMYTNGTQSASAANTSFTVYRQMQVAYFRYTSGNTGFQVPLGSTAVSGTWRCLMVAPPRLGSFDSYDNKTGSQLAPCIAVRVS